MQNPATRAISYCRTRLLSDGFLRNVMIMLTGSVLGQLFTVLLSPFLTRIYSPEMFGVLGVFTAAIGILSTVATLRYEMGLPLVHKDSEAADLLCVCFIALITTTAVSVMVIFALCLFLHETPAFRLYAPYCWFFPVGFLCVGAFNVMLFYATRQNDFQSIARTKVYQGAVGPGIQIVLGLNGAGAMGLLTGYILGQSAGILFLFRRLIVKPRVLTAVSIGGMRAVAQRFRRFMLVSSWAGIMESTGNTYFLLITLPFLYSSTIVGYIFLTDRIIGRPLFLISTSILQVYVGDVSRNITSDPKEVRRRFLQMAGHQLIIVATWLGIANIAAPYAIPLVFGKQWAGSVPYLQVLSLAYLPQLVIHAITHTLQVLEKQALSATWEAFRLFSIAVAIFGSAYAGFDALHALLSYSIVQVVAHIILFWLMYASIQSIQKVKKHEEV